MPKQKTKTIKLTISKRIEGQHKAKGEKVTTSETLANELIAIGSAVEAKEDKKPANKLSLND